MHQHLTLELLSQFNQTRPRKRKDVVVIKDWCGVMCNDSQSSLIDIFHNHMQGRYDKTANVYDQDTASRKNDLTEMSSNVEVCDAVSSVGSFIEFVSRKLDDDELTSTVIETTVVRKNAFTILTSAANHAKYLPDKRKEIINKTRM